MRLAWDLGVTVKLLVPRDNLVASSASSCLRLRHDSEGTGTLYLDVPCSKPSVLLPRKTGKIYGPSKHGRA